MGKRGRDTRNNKSSIKLMRKLVIGDIHGNYKGLIQALERSGFDYDLDTLISLGDVVDGHSESYEVVEELLKIKNLIAIKGNHDDWFNEWIQTGVSPSNWGQGQSATALSYIKRDPSYSHITEANVYNIPHLLKPEDIPASHVEFFGSQLSYMLDENNNLFIHGGFNRHLDLKQQPEYVFWWDRDLWSQALSFKATKPGGLGIGDWKPTFKMHGDFKEVFIGHTSTQFWDEDKPMNAANIWNLDTGGGWFGKVSIMEVDTKEYWQSDKASELYPEFKGRK
jgi:serine/threonine protein phosphatase 1